MAGNGEDLTNSLKRLEAIFNNNDIPVIVGNAWQNRVIRTFNEKAYEGKAWEPRQYPTKKNKGKPLLVKTGALKGSLSRAIKVANWKIIRWSTNIPYAKLLNDGGTVHRAERATVLSFSKKNKRVKNKKAFYQQKVQIKEHTATYPARPFSRLDRPTILFLKDVFLKELKKRVKQINR